MKSKGLKTKKPSQLVTIIALILLIAGEINPVIAASKPTLKRIEPPCWWTGFKNPSLELMVYGERISSYLLNMRHWIQPFRLQ